MSSPGQVPGSPMKPESPDPFLKPHLIPQKRFRTISSSERTLPEKMYGEVIDFCRVKGHGFIKCDPCQFLSTHGISSDDQVFVHVSDIQDAFVPLAGDRVNFKLCPIPPKFMKYQAVEVHLENPDINKHKTWSEHFDAEGNMSTSPVRDPVLSSID